MDSLFISNNIDCFSIDIKYILFSIAPQIMEAEQKLELQAELITNIRTNNSKGNPNWKYKTVEGINLIHYHDRIYVPKTLRKYVLKCYHCYFQHPGGDILAQTLTTICRCPGIVYQEQKLCITCKDSQQFKNRNAKYGLLPSNDFETLAPYHTVCVDLILTYTILANVDSLTIKYSQRNFNYYA